MFHLKHYNMDTLTNNNSELQKDTELQPLSVSILEPKTRVICPHVEITNGFRVPDGTPTGKRMEYYVRGGYGVCNCI